MLHSFLAILRDVGKKLCHLGGIGCCLLACLSPRAKVVTELAFLLSHVLNSAYRLLKQGSAVMRVDYNRISVCYRLLLLFDQAIERVYLLEKVVKVSGGSGALDGRYLVVLQTRGRLHTCLKGCRYVCSRLLHV